MDPTVTPVHRPSGDMLALHRFPDPGGPVAVILPAMGTPARFYRHFAAALHDTGFAVAVADLRGNGASTPAPGRATRYGYAELADDVGAVCAELGRERPVLLVGHSLGGQIGLIHAALNPGTVAGVALVAAGIPYWRAYPGRRRFGILGVTQTIGAASAVLGVWPGWGFGGRQAARVMTDWARTARPGTYRHLPGVDDALAKLDTPVLAVSIEHDTLLPAPVVDHFVTLMPAQLVRRTHFTTADLGAPADHFTWARGPAAVRVARELQGFARDLGLPAAS